MPLLHSIAAATLVALVACGPLPPTNLLLEYRQSPVFGMDVPQPRFSWAAGHTDRGQAQTAYQVLVGSNPDVSKVTWDSGKVASADVAQIVYGGIPLVDDSTYFWKVRFFDNQDVASDFSVVAQFDTGLSNSSWKAQWITATPPGRVNRAAVYYRRELKLTSAASRARVYMVGLGYHRLSINGQDISANQKLGEFTTFQRRIIYDTFDVTAALSSGPNVIGVTVGDGWSTLASVHETPLLFQLEVVLADGTQVQVISSAGNDWLCSMSPITMNSIFDGEFYDARLEQPNWDSPSGSSALNMSNWVPTVAYSLFGGKRTPILVARSGQANMRHEIYNPSNVTDLGNRTFMMTNPQNMAGVCKVTIPAAPAGTVVLMQHDERLGPDGHLALEYGKNAMQLQYIMRGTGSAEVYEPSFTYYGFTYIQVTGWPGSDAPRPEDFECYFVHTAMPASGAISFSDPMVNSINHIVRFASQSNFVSTPTDCPTRERRGWLGDAQVSSETVIYNFDPSAAYTKFLADISDSQWEALTDALVDGCGPFYPGTMPDVSPFYGHGRLPSDPSWGIARIVLPFRMYQYYGDVRVLEKYYSEMKWYLDSVNQQAANSVTGQHHCFNMSGPFGSSVGLLNCDAWGDWCPASGGCFNIGNLISAQEHVRMYKIMIQVATALGNSADVATFSTQFSTLSSVFHKAFFDGSQYIDHHSRVGASNQALPLYVGITPAESVKTVAAALNDAVLNQDGGHLTAGIVGIGPILEELAKNGYFETAWLAGAAQRSFPSYATMVSGGGTTLCETWDCTGGTRNHIMYGANSAFYYQYGAGITLADFERSSVGWRNISFSPGVPRHSDLFNLTSVSASISSHRGLIVAAWTTEVSGSILQYNVTVPVGSAGTVNLPLLGADSSKVIVKDLAFSPADKNVIFSNGQYQAGVAGVFSARASTDVVSVVVGSGSYLFSVSL